MTFHFKRDSVDEYPFERPKTMRAYADTMKRYLKQQFPGQSDDALELFVTELIKKSLKRPKVQIQHHPRYGVTQTKVVDLLDHITGIDDSIITPAGVVYMPAAKKKSMLSEVLEQSVLARNKFKHLQLEAAAIGDAVKEGIYKLLQASAKIFNNSIPGAMGTIYSFLYDLPGYNAITSVSRQCVKTGYSHTERMLGSNLYLPSTDDVINYCVNHLRVCPHARVQKVMAQYKLSYPSVDTVTAFFLESVQFYRPTGGAKDTIRKYVSTLTDDERAFIFYAYGYRNLLIENEAVMREYLKEFFRRDIPADPAADPKSIYKVESDLLAMAMSLNFDTINREPKMEEAIVNHPDGVRALLAICHHMEKCLTSWNDVWHTFFMVDVDLARMWEHPDIVRRCVLVSDTDSVIFSTDMVTNWYTSKRFSQDAYDINALSVFMVSQTLEHLFARTTAGLGVKGAERKRIKMKNEFYYPVFIRSPMAKHYIGPVHIQEGKVLPKPKLDIKGLNYRGSDLPAATTSAFNTFTEWLLDAIIAAPQISGSEMIGKVAEHERRIYTSLMSGERTFLPTRSVRRAEEYADAMSSDYFYWLLWDRVFKPSFGEFVIPNKGYVLPLMGRGAILKTEEWRAALRKADKGLDDRLTAFMDEFPKKNITRIIVPPSLSEIPEVLRAALDVRRIIYANGRPFFLLTKSLGYALGDKSGQFIASDFIQLENPIEVPLAS